MTAQPLHGTRTTSSISTMGTRLCGTLFTTMATIKHMATQLQIATMASALNHKFTLKVVKPTSSKVAAVTERGVTLDSL